MSAPVKSLENWSSSGGGAIALNISIHYSKQKFHCSRDSGAMLLLYLLPLRAPNHWQRRRNLEMASLVFGVSLFFILASLPEPLPEFTQYIYTFLFRVFSSHCLCPQRGNLWLIWEETDKKKVSQKAVGRLRTQHTHNCFSVFTCLFLAFFSCHLFSAKC